jgi:UDP-N-acetyl-D-glucosamine dehydrogenase
MKANGLIVSTDFSNVKDASAVIICVTAPLNKNREPDISFILETGGATARRRGIESN